VGLSVVNRMMNVGFPVGVAAAWAVSGVVVTVIGAVVVGAAAVVPPLSPPPQPVTASPRVRARARFTPAILPTTTADTITNVRYRTVLFDLDGTLVDSAAMILASFRHATRTVLRREIPDQELLAAVGGPGLRAQMEALAPDCVDELIHVYSEHNVGLHPGLQACDGTLHLLETLKEQGRRLGVVTAKRRATLALAFEVLPELEAYFDATIAAEDTNRHKPHPQPLLAALERLDETPDHAAYIGDSPFDVQAAKAAQMGAIVVSWGAIHARERLERERPDAIVDTCEELLGCI
jgi:pyrophosphatase PpaX